MIAGNLLQQFYNIADTMIVGRFLGKNALAAVGSSFTLMTFLTSIILGLAMGSGVLFSMKFGEKDEEALRRAIYTAIDTARNRARFDRERSNPLKKQYFEKRDDSDKLKLDQVTEEDEA